MKKIIAVILMLCIFTAMVAGTAAARPSAKSMQIQNIQGAGLSVSAMQTQDDFVLLSPNVAVGTLSQTTIAQVTGGVLVSTQITKAKIII